MRPDEFDVTQSCQRNTPACCSFAMRSARPGEQHADAHVSCIFAEPERPPVRPRRHQRLQLRHQVHVRPLNAVIKRCHVPLAHGPAVAHALWTAQLSMQCAAADTLRVVFAARPTRRFARRARKGVTPGLGGA